MSDLINRQAAINAVENTDCELSSDAWDEITDAIMQLPSAQKRGEWIWSPVADDGTVRGCCNKCKFSHVFIGGHTAQYNFCPNCGADMRSDIHKRNIEEYAHDMNVSLEQAEKELRRE